MSELLRLDDIWKSYSTPSGGEITILKGVDLTLSEGEIVSIVGKSGSGKSTLLSIAALLMPPDRGEISYSGRSASALSEREVQKMRGKAMGFVFQSSILLEDFSALENIAMPMMIHGLKRREAPSEAEKYLDLAGIRDRRDHRPCTLSGGERQRVAIARALAGNPLVIFADEPTGSLDEKSAAMVENLLLGAVRNTGHCMLLVTHNMAFASRADRVLELKEGVLSDV